ncbi:hypothetical protein N7493_007391 [Penicillium malachiteum]|uniref:Heterokaryon incompatibility domain-containing protein n=1 Tax=Penicillium malachiteum TaxID=1324776 RepID=A0AAD6MUS2_9EURO|nr:hypothetical protein N7493_007391 [Penicillium malachiteum]
MPKRLIDLGDDENDCFCLLENFERPCRYIALSHSWQISIAYEARTLKANLEERKSSIDQKGLSKTFRDFFAIARWLKIPYVWIDTFCIIQDSDKDWAEQAAVMGNIYEGAYVTVASHYEPSGSTEDGCFLHRDVLQEVPLVDAHSQPFSMFIKLPYNHVTNIESLMSRAWCVQERLLSARILHCRSSEMVFECFTETHCECETLGFEVEDDYELRVPEKDISELFAASQQEIDNREEPNEAQCWEHWQSIIALYTRSQLTQKTDRLPALSSLAQRMPRRIFGNYLAGIWTGDFHNQLLWSHNLNDHVLQPEEYVAPSFSWASLYGGNTRWYDTVPKNAPGQRARILGMSAVPKTKDLMGSVKSGVIHMRLRMIEAKVTFIDKETSKIRLAYMCKTALLYDCSAEADAVNVRPFLVDKKVYLGEIISGAGFSKFLILVRMGSSSTFQRVGIGRFSREEGRARKHMEHDAFHQCEEQTIDLV